MVKRAQRFCRTCGALTLHETDQVETGCLAHAVLTVLTLGLWLPFALFGIGLASVAGTVAAEVVRRNGTAVGSTRLAAVDSDA